MRWFNKARYTSIGDGSQEKKVELPPGLWTKCPDCQELIFNKLLMENLKVCPSCGFYFRLTAYERMDTLVEEGSFRDLFNSLESVDPLSFPAYAKKLATSRKKTNLKEAVVTGEAGIGSHPVALGVFDFSFVGGSMGSVVGEKITRLAEHALEQRLPLVIVSAGGGGARMHEGMFSLMQMAKTSAAVARLKEAAVPFISVITHPTMGGVSASFASQGDVIIAEPKALAGFAGPRVIEQTIGQRLPDGFQSSEFLLDHGMLDAVVERSNLKQTVVTLLDHLTAGPRFKQGKTGAGAQPCAPASQ